MNNAVKFCERIREFQITWMGDLALFQLMFWNQSGDSDNV